MEEHRKVRSGGLPESMRGENAQYDKNFAGPGAVRECTKQEMEMMAKGVFPDERAPMLIDPSGEHPPRRLEMGGQATGRYPPEPARAPLDTDSFLPESKPYVSPNKATTEPSRDPWEHRSVHMRCKTCMWYSPKAVSLGRCRRHAPTMGGYPVVFTHDWCGDHKLNEEAV